MAGADGAKGHSQRMRKLEHAFQRTVKYSLRGVPHDEFGAYFPEGPLSDAVLESAFDGYRQCLVQARTAIEVDFQEVCEESAIIDKLYTMDIMCAQQGIGDGDATATAGGAAPTKAARAAALAAKKEEAARLAGILEEARRLETEAEAALTQKKATAREMVAAAEPMGKSDLAEVRDVAAAWARRGDPAAAGAGPSAGAATPAAKTPGGA